MHIKTFIYPLLIALAGAAWSQSEIERDLDGNATIFQTAPSQPQSPKKTGGANVQE